MAFQCILVTPEQQVLDEPVVQAIVPAHDGQVGVLTNRAPLIMKLGLGEMRLDSPNGQKRYFYVEGGVAQVKNNKLTILTHEAILADHIDAKAARAELAEAEARRTTSEPGGSEQREKSLARARARIRIAERA
jgi:F-type H+-transporting ATPase subunit epsilon